MLEDFYIPPNGEGSPLVLPGEKSIILVFCCFVCVCVYEIILALAQGLDWGVGQE